MVKQTTLASPQTQRSIEQPAMLPGGEVQQPFGIIFRENELCLYGALCPGLWIALQTSHNNAPKWRTGQCPRYERKPEHLVKQDNKQAQECKYHGRESRPADKVEMMLWKLEIGPSSLHVGCFERWIHLVSILPCATPTLPTCVRPFVAFKTDN